MSDDLQELYVQQYLSSQQGEEVIFSFQGGEPTLIGLPYFERLVTLVGKYKLAHQKIRYVLQTNGTRLNDEWGMFLKKNEVLVGISIDGPAELHDAYRVNKGGFATHAKVMNAIVLLQKYNINYNTLTVINNLNSQHPLEVYKFLRSTGSCHMQFIPIVERQKSASQDLCGAPSLDSVEKDFKIPEWNVRPKDFGRFYNAIYDEWVCNDVGKVYIQMFDLQLGLHMGLPSSLCVYGKTCGAAGIMEHNGDVYSCDHFVYPEFKLGNIREKSLVEMFESEHQHKFGQDKFDKLPMDCKTCKFLKQCYGGCPKHRFNKGKNGEPGLNYLCDGYKLFFEHIEPTMAYMANCIRNRQPPANVMGVIRQKDKQPLDSANRNALCPCGSGKKIKRCCGKQRVAGYTS